MTFMGEEDLIKIVDQISKEAEGKVIRKVEYALDFGSVILTITMLEN